MSETAIVILIGCFFLFFIALELYLLIVGHKRVVDFPLEKAYKEVQDSSNDWVVSLVVAVVADVIAWFWLGNRVSRPIFIFILIGADLLLILLAAIEYDTKSVAKKKIKESEQRGVEQQEEDHQI